MLFETSRYSLSIFLHKIRNTAIFLSVSAPHVQRQRAIYIWHSWYSKRGPDENIIINYRILSESKQPERMTRNSIQWANFLTAINKRKKKWNIFNCYRLGMENTRNTEKCVLDSRYGNLKMSLRVFQYSPVKFF